MTRIMTNINADVDTLEDNLTSKRNYAEELETLNRFKENVAQCTNAAWNIPRHEISYVSGKIDRIIEWINQEIANF